MSIIRTICILLASIVATLCLALFLVLTTPAGLVFLEQNINALQSSATISGLRGSLLGQLSVDEITISDTNGTWLTLSEAKLRWSPKELLRGTLHIPFIRARSLELSRLPESAGEPEPKPATSELPSFLPELVLDEFRIERILLGSVVKPAIPALTLSGATTVVSPSGPGRVELHLHPIAQEHPRLNLMADLEGNALTCSGTFDDPTGSMVAFLAGLPAPQPVNLSFRGSGSRGSYQGDLSLQARRLLASDLHMKWSGPDTAGNLRGQVRLDPTGPLAAASSWTGEVLDLDLRTYMDEQGRQVRNDLDISSRLLRLSAASGIDLQKLLTDTSFSLTHTDPARLAEQTGIFLQGPTPLTGTLTGRLSGPDLSCSVQAESLGAGTLRVEQPEITLTAAPSENEGSPKYSATLHTTAEDVTLPDILRSGPLQVQTVLQGIGTQSIQARLQASAKGLDLKGTTSLAPKTGTLTTEISSTLRPTALFSPEIGPVPETLELSGSLNGNISATDLVAKLNMQLGTFPEGPALLADLLGPKSTLNCSAHLNDIRLNLDALTIDGTGVTASGSGSYLLDSGRYRTDLTGNVHGAALSPDTAHLGKIDLAAQASGTDRQIALSARVTPQSGPVFGLPLTFIQLDSELEELDTAPAGQWRLEVGTTPGPLHIAGALNLADGLSIARGTFDGLDLKGTFNVDIPADQSRKEVRFQVASTALESAALLVDQPLRGEVNVKGSYVETEQSTKLTLSGTGRDLRYGDALSVAGLELPRLTLNPTAPEQPELDLTLKKLVAGNLTLDRAELHTAARNQELHFSLTGEGSKPAPVHLSLSGLTRQEENGRTVRLEKLQGEYNSFPVRLLDPAELRLRNGLPSITPTSLALGDGSLEIKGALTESAINGHADLRGLTTASLQLLTQVPLPRGRLNTTASLTGSPDKPDLVTRLRIEDMVPAQAEPDNDITTTLDITARTTPDGLEAQGSLEGLGSAPLTLFGTVPFVLSLRPVRVELPETPPMQISARGDLDLNRISDLLGLPELDLAGRLGLDVSATGTTTAPDLAGVVSLQNGRAEYVRTGTVLEQIQAEVLLAGDRLDLKTFSATDGGKGTLFVDGNVTLPLRSPLSYALTANMKEARLLTSDTATAHVDGTCRVRGDGTGTTVQADLTIPRAEVNISRNPDPSLVPVSVREINVAEGDRVKEAAKPALPPEVTLDVVVTIPGRFYVRGRGLESEWKGALNVTGTAAAPVVRGKLESVRGTLAFAGRDLELTTGEVTLGGAVPPNPILNIVSSATIDSTEAQVKIQGPARKPELIMASVPSLPEDEVLSLLLFGDSVARLTPMQALQLANTARTLAGTSGEGGFDPMAFTRSLLGLDDIKVGSAEEGGMQVGLGKYLTDDIYVEVEKGLTSDKDTLSVEMEVTPHIEVETEVGTDSNGKVGLNWKWEY